MKVFAEFWERGVINKGVNATVLILIPKKEGALELLDYRPINLVGSLYKIIAKVLSLRLRDVMDKVTFDSQGTFVKGHQIMDGIFIANECVELKKKKDSRLVCKIDLEKAYDRVDCDFLKWVHSFKYRHKTIKTYRYVSVSMGFDTKPICIFKSTLFQCYH